MIKLVKKLLKMLFSATSGPAVMPDDDLAFFESFAYPDDKRPGADTEIQAQMLIKDGTLYGAKSDTPGTRLGRELDRKSATVYQCRNQADSACPGCFLPWKNGPRAKA